MDLEFIENTWPRSDEYNGDIRTLDCQATHDHSKKTGVKRM